MAAYLVAGNFCGIHASLCILQSFIGQIPGKFDLGSHDGSKHQVHMHKLAIFTKIKLRD